MNANIPLPPAALRTWLLAHGYDRPILRWQAVSPVVFQVVLLGGMELDITLPRPVEMPPAQPTPPEGQPRVQLEASPGARRVRRKS